MEKVILPVRKPVLCLFHEKVNSKPIIGFQIVNLKGLCVIKCYVNISNVFFFVLFVCAKINIEKKSFNFNSIVQAMENYLHPIVSQFDSCFG